MCVWFTKPSLYRDCCCRRVDIFSKIDMQNMQFYIFNGRIGFCENHPTFLSEKHVSPQVGEIYP